MSMFFSLADFWESSKWIMLSLQIISKSAGNKRTIERDWALCVHRRRSGGNFKTAGTKFNTINQDPSWIRLSAAQPRSLTMQVINGNNLLLLTTGAWKQQSKQPSLAGTECERLQSSTLASCSVLDRREGNLSPGLWQVLEGKVGEGRGLEQCKMQREHRASVPRRIRA